MSSASVLIDTSAWIETLRLEGDPEIRATVKSAMEAGTACLCDLVLLELWNGAHGLRQKALLKNLEHLLPRVPTTDAVWALAQELARSCRDVGLTLPASDLVVAACARAHNLTLLHRDAHFDRLEAELPRLPS